MADPVPVLQSGKGNRPVEQSLHLSPTTPALQKPQPTPRVFNGQTVKNNFIYTGRGGGHKTLQ